MSDEDELDYMSEDVLFECTKNDVRPGLIHNHSTKRKIEVEKKRAKNNENYNKKMRPIKEIQEERLKEGLKTAIDTSNKGYSMLQKMGYKPGTSLGKLGKGLIEPVAVEIKSDRVGLGWQQLLKLRRQQHEEKWLLQQQNKKELFDPQEYRARMSNIHHEKKMLADLAKSQKMCYTLDSREGITYPHEHWFWPSYAFDSEESEEDGQCEADDSNVEHESQEIPKEDDTEDVFEPSEQLEVITLYLRTTYFYCIWCSATFDDVEDLNKFCPGTSRADHDE